MNTAREERFEEFEGVHLRDDGGGGNRAWRIIPWALLGMTIGILLVTLPLLSALAVAVGMALLIVMAKKPEYAVLAIVVLNCSIVFEDKLPLLPIGVGSLHFADIFLLFLLGVVIFRIIANDDIGFAKSPLNLPLGLFMLSVTGAAAVSIYSYDLDFNHVMRIFRGVSFYMLFYVMTNLINDEKRMRSLLRGMFFIAMAVAAAMLVQDLVGDKIRLLPGRVEAASSFGSAYEAMRILPPGHTLVYTLFVTALCLIVFIRERPILFSGYFYIMLALGVGVLLTYNRNYWVALIVTVTLLLLVTSTGSKTRLIALIFLVSLFAGSAILTLGASGGRFGEITGAVSDRFATLLSGKEVASERSLEDRYLENYYAMRKIAENPVMGIGLGNHYRPAVFGADDDLTFYVHNGYLWLLTDTGFVGFAFFMWFYIGFLVRGIRSLSRLEDDFFRALIAGFTLSGVGVLFMVMVNPVFMQHFSIVVLAIMIGLTEAMIRIDEERRAVEHEAAANG